MYCHHNKLKPARSALKQQRINLLVNDNNFIMIVLCVSWARDVGTGQTELIVSNIVL